ncbi:OmpA family protein [Nesterenkonia suensis]
MRHDHRWQRRGPVAGLATVLALSGCGIFAPEETVDEQDFEDSVSTAEDGSIVLESDILFSANSWELPRGADVLIAELAEAVPEGAEVHIIGHTDSRPIRQSDEDLTNEELSERRAQSVADALSSERDDLLLTIEGRADTDPAVEEDPTEPSTYAENRRVEIRFED